MIFKGHPWGKTVSAKEKFLTAREKEADGSYKALFDMFNSDLPPS
jgi:hypothetical protein